MVRGRSNLEFVARPMTHRAKFTVRFPIDNKYLSFEPRVFAEVGRNSVNFHSLAAFLTNRITNGPVLALKQVLACEIRTCARGSGNKREREHDEERFHPASQNRKTG